MIDCKVELLAPKDWLMYLKRNGFAKTEKARKFLKNKCLIKDGKEYKCSPLEGYNKRTYIITKENGQWNCTCQGFDALKKRGIQYPECSHTLAVKMYIRNENGITEEGIEPNKITNRWKP